MYIWSLADSKAAGFDPLGNGARWHTLVSSELGHADEGEVGVLDLPAAPDQVLAQFPARAGIVVLSGAPIITAGDERWRGRPGTVLDVEAGAAFALHSAEQTTELLVFLSGGARHDNIRIEAGQTLGQVQVFQDVDVPLIDIHDPERGFYDMRARILIDAMRGSSELILGRTWFAPAVGRHELHRHPHAEEAFFVTAGRGIALSSIGEAPIGPGTIVFAARDEWHGQYNASDTALEGYFGFLGAGSLDDCGYELALST